MDIRRGEVFYADLSPVVGSEQGGVRPVLIIQNTISVLAAATLSHTSMVRFLSQRSLSAPAKMLSRT